MAITLFWKHCLNDIKIDCDGFEVETLINLRMHKANMKIIEVPSFEYPRIHGESNLNTFKDGWRVLKTIFRERQRKSPLLFSPLVSGFSTPGEHTSPQKIVQ